MSVKYGELCSVLILENFGNVAQKIHDELIWGPKTYKLLLSATGLPSGLIKRALCILIQYGFVSFETGRNPLIAEYVLQQEKIILLLRYPKYLSLINAKRGEPSRLLVEEVLKHGSITATKAILQAWKRIQQGAIAKYTDGISGLKEFFHQLIVNQYLICCPTPSESTGDDCRVPQFTVNEEEFFSPPEIDLRKLMDLEKGIPNSDPGDTGIMWRCNFDRFHQDLRDEIVIEAVRRRFDNEASTFMDLLLQLMYERTDPWATSSNPIPFVTIRDSLEKKKWPHLSQYLDQYIKVIEEDSCNFIRRSGEGSTSSVFVNLATALQNITAAAIENVVEHRFGCKAARIFRLVKKKRYIDQEQLQKLAMIPDKEAKQLTYKLLQESFLHLHELRKPVSSGPNKSFYLLHIDFKQVAQVVLNMCYKGIYNTLIRAKHEKTDNSRLIEKFEKLNTIAKNMREQGDDENYIKQLLNEWMTPPEKALLDSVEAMTEKLRMAELYVDETIFLIQLFTYYESANLREKP
ncbi:RNA polymerase III subunit C isoform X1 [Rhodnius prolixus]|uniref:DNA-directed RNA polymerase III subunit RPC3 n=2 Tax=Rhodnius prolixus TaxID=13249 RepID=R4G8T2_RHOPR